MSGVSEKYALGERIGAGGMAEVFRATQKGAEGFARTVAIKRIRPEFSGRPQFAEMFANEAKLACQLVHPNVVSVYDFDRDTDGNLFLAMELVEGTDLRTLLRPGALDPTAACFVAKEVLQALQAAHTQGVVHRDVSPDNILVSWNGAVKLSDFGIAKAAQASGLTESGLLKGKISYMSPEQIEGGVIDARADLFALGVVLYEALSGRRLFQADGSPREILSRVLSQKIPELRKVQPSVPAPLSSFCMKLLERDRSRRFATAEQAAAALVRITPPLSNAEALVAAMSQQATLGSEADSTTPAGQSANSPTVAIVVGAMCAMLLFVVLGGLRPEESGAPVIPTVASTKNSSDIDGARTATQAGGPQAQEVKVLSSDAKAAADAPTPRANSWQDAGGEQPTPNKPRAKSAPRRVRPPRASPREPNSAAPAQETVGDRLLRPDF